MEVKAFSWTVATLFVNQLVYILAKNVVVYFPTDGTLSLSPSKVPGAINSIMWRHGENLVAEWIKDAIDLQYYGIFVNRTEMNIVTGNLKITRATEADSGVYSVEINSVSQPDRYEAKMVGEVPDLYVWVKPGQTNNLFILYCDPVQGQDNALKAAQPVSYRWKIGTADWVELGNKVEIHVNETTLLAQTFTCQMVNPVSDKTSKGEPNPFYGRVPTKEPGTNVDVGVGVGVGMGVPVVVGLLWIAFAYVKKKFPFHQTGNVPISPNVDEMETNNLNPPPEKGSEST